ncbi:MAG: DUF3047 domain-containing protein [Betaproteobacteria bacterium]
MVALLAAAAVAAAIAPLVVGPFAQATPGGPLPAGWVPLTFSGVERHTEYSLVRDGDGTVVVRALADRSASGLIRKVDLPTDERPLLAWRWKVDRLLTRGDVRRKEGDDYPARVYVSFRYSPERLSFAQRIRWGTYRVFYGEYPPHAALNYIWDANAPAGTTVPNPFTDRVRMIVVESGSARLSQWLDYERDIAADYRIAFGEEAPPISGIALMTDADNTGETAAAYYGDITLSPRR